MSRQDKATTEKHSKMLRNLVKRSENKLCADCKRNDPRWASWNLGVFLCIRCSGFHRGMGTHISRVKSIDLDVWTAEQMESIQKWGNRRANSYWEAHLKPGHVPPDHKMESFIRSKYESRRWALEGPPPSDPSTLDEQVTAPTPSSPPADSTARSSPASLAAATTRQPQTHRLLSATLASKSATPATIQDPPPLAAASPAQPVNDLFSLDFHAPSTVNPTSVEPKKDVKQDILSLFSSPAASGSAQPSTMFPRFDAASQPQMSPWDQTNAQRPVPVQSTSMMGNSGSGLWGTSSGWNPLPAQGNVWTSSQPQPTMLGAGNPWASTSAAPEAAGMGSDLFGSGLTGATKKKDDAFADLWK